MRVGMIGFGSIGARHYRNLLPYSQDIVVLSRRGDLTDIDAVRRWHQFKARAPFDVIFITNETAKHLATLRRCLPLRPRAIFLEKPLSHNTAGISVLSALLKKAGVSVWVGYNFHFFPPYLAIKRLLDAKKLGRPYYLRASVGQDLRVWRSGRDYRLSYSARKRRGGGVLLDLVHDINYPAWLLGEPLIFKSAVVKKLSHLAADTEDCADSLFTTRNGVVVSVHQDYLRVPLKTSVEIVGSRGSLTWDSQSGSMTVETARKKTVRKMRSERNKMFAAEMAFFFRSVRKGRWFSNIGEAARDMKLIAEIKKHGKA